MPAVLIVSYGNPLRSDDGLAWRASDQLEGKFPQSEVEILRVHQLMPELAETVSRSRAVIFVDAASAVATGNGHPGKVCCEEIRESVTESGFSHHLSPPTVLALAHQLFDASPRAFSVTLTGQCFDHGDALSPIVTAALPVLAARIEAIIRQLLSEQAPPPE